MIGAILLCTIVSIPDADGARCATGERIRIAAVSGLERDGTCNSAPDCASIPYKLAKATAEALLLNVTVSFLIVDQNGKPGTKRFRWVGENAYWRCQLVQSGAVVPWPKWEVRYGLRVACRG